MKRILGAALAALVLAGCGKGKGEQWADKTNEKMVKKINAGEVKSEEEIPLAKFACLLEAANELGIDEKTKTTESDKNKCEELMKKYEEEWKKLIREKYPKK